MTVIGIVLMVVSVVPVAIAAVAGGVAAVDLAENSVALPATSQWIMSGDLKEGTYDVWSSNGRWLESCELAVGDPKDGRAVRLSAPGVSAEVNMGTQVSLSVVKQFDSTGEPVSLRCYGAEDEGQAVLFYLVPAAKAGVIVPVVVGLGLAQLLGIAGLALVIVQTLRRASWNNRHLRQFGAI